MFRRFRNYPQIGGGAKLPYDAEVEWIESNSSRVLSGYVPTKNFRIEFKARINTGLSAYVDTITANTYNASQTNFFLSLGVGSNANVFRSVVFSNNSAAEFTLGSDRIVDGYFDLNNTSVNGITKKNFRVGSYGTSAMDIGRRCRLYYLRIIDNNNLVKDYIPVRINGIGLLFDRVEGTLNSYNGDVVIGPDKAA